MKFSVSDHDFQKHPFYVYYAYILMKLSMFQYINYIDQSTAL